MTKQHDLSHTSTLRITKLSASGIIGVHPWEREQEQTLYISLQLGVDTAAAAVVDELTNAVDYSAVAEQVRELVKDTKAQLIEHLAERIAEQLLSDYALGWVSVEVHKPDAVPGTQDISIEVTREQATATTQS